MMMKYLDVTSATTELQDSDEGSVDYRLWNDKNHAQVAFYCDRSSSLCVEHFRSYETHDIVDRGL